MQIVLVEPEIPYNTGNIARTCAVTGTTLHLVKPLGFSLDDRYLKRAGLDYWHLVDVQVHESFSEVREKYSQARFYYCTTKGNRLYHEVSYDVNDFLVFGAETRGLPPDMLAENRENCVKIPMREGLRSLNLANSVAIILYEALRQQGFPF